MRGIEAAIKVLNDSRKSQNKFANELLRTLASQEKMKSTDISLASSLIYIVMRRRELWENIASNFLKKNNDFDKLPEFVKDCILIGTGGLLELRRFSSGVLVNGIVENLRTKKFMKFVPLVNAVLHNVNESGSQKLEYIKKSPLNEERALWAGIPVLTLPAWLKTWNKQELNSLFDYMIQPPASSLRVSPTVDAKIISEKFEGEISPLSGAIHLNGTVNPTELEGFKEGLFTIQSESSILTASIVKKFYDKKNNILDMCSGRGVKAAQILQENPDAFLECWELSDYRQKSAEDELKRLNIINRASLKNGNALNLKPDKEPSFIVLDAPCSCSGTWNRKPESKWRFNWKNFDKLIYTQKKLLEHAVNLCSKNGYILYITCSLLKQENENIIADILSKYQESCVEVSSLLKWNKKPFRKGKPWGVYIMPENPWLDGFYCSLIFKK